MAVGAELWPQSHSEMSERIRRHDWGVTVLGVPDSWPAALRLLLETVLEAPVPMCILWGEQALQLYNDAHAALIVILPNSASLPVVAGVPPGSC